MATVDLVLLRCQLKAWTEVQKALAAIGKTPALMALRFSFMELFCIIYADILH